MKSEHHFDPRPAHEIDVHIQYGNRHFRSAKGRHLSKQGMYLEVEHLTLPAGTVVVLEVRDMDRRWHVPAIVVHQDGAGIGVRFRATPPALTDRSTGSNLPLLAAHPNHSL